jgi:hypothetical protein
VSGVKSSGNGLWWGRFWHRVACGVRYVVAACATRRGGQTAAERRRHEPDGWPAMALFMRAEGCEPFSDAYARVQGVVRGGRRPVFLFTAEGAEEDEG